MNSVRAYQEFRGNLLAKADTLIAVVLTSLSVTFVYMLLGLAFGTLRNVVFFWGTVGAFSAYFFILYRLRKMGLKPKSLTFYPAASIILVIGGLMTTFVAKNAIGALYIGHSLPGNLAFYLGIEGLAKKYMRRKGD